MGHGFWPKERPDIPNRLGQTAALDRGSFRKGGQEPAGGCPFQNYEAAFVFRSADQAPEGLLEPQARDLVVITLAELSPPGLVQDGRLGPGNLVEHHEP